MGVLDSNLIQSHVGESFLVTSTEGGVLLSFIPSFERIPDNISYAVDYCKHITSGSYNSVLMGGLGLGIVSQWIAKNTSCETIDVVEINAELINWVKNENYLDPKINIIEGDIFTYTPTKTYDLIIYDIWWNSASYVIEHENPEDNETITFQNIIDSLITQHNNYLNDGGSFYFPIYAPMDLYPKNSTSAIYPAPAVV